MKRKYSTVNIEDRMKSLVNSLKVVNSIRRYESESAEEKRRNAWSGVEKLTADLLRRGYDWDMCDYDAETGDLSSISLYRSGEFLKEIYL